MTEELEYKGIEIKPIWKEEAPEGMNYEFEVKEIWAPHYPKSKDDFIYKPLQ